MYDPSSGVHTKKTLSKKLSYTPATGGNDTTLVIRSDKVNRCLAIKILTYGRAQNNVLDCESVHTESVQLFSRKNYKPVRSKTHSHTVHSLWRCFHVSQQALTVILLSIFSTQACCRQKYHVLTILFLLYSNTFVPLNIIYYTPNRRSIIEIPQIMNRPRERVPTGRRGRPSKSMIAAALERPFCAYLHKVCLNNRLEGHKFCIDHIMNDKTAPYRQCTFVHTVTGRRCTRAAHKVDRRAAPLCQYHRALKVNAPPAPQEEEPTRLLDDLAHHLPSTEPKESINTFWTPKEDGSATPSAKLIKILANYSKRAAANIELPSMDEIAARHNNADSDTESVDNNLDMFKHASIFTEEELTRTLRDKMIKLRRLYIEQYGFIQYILKEKRLKYIQAQRNEDSIAFRDNIVGPDCDRLRAMLKYHKSSGPDYLLREQAKRRKTSRPPTVGPHPHPQTENISTPSDKTPVCIFSKTASQCQEPTIPMSPYCKRHILFDTKQVLFRPCAGGAPPCLTPVSSFRKNNRCWLH